MYSYSLIPIFISQLTVFALGLEANSQNVRSAIRKESDSLEVEEKSFRCSPDYEYAWCLPETYTSEENPFQHHAMVPDKPLPWKYNFTFNVKDIGKINDKSQYISMSMYFAVKWFEPRLKINESAPSWSNVKMGPEEEITISLQNLKHFWYPELEIYGIDSFRKYHVLKQMAGLRIKKDRTIKYEVKAEITISCKMNFDKYPLDNQTCLFQVGSYYGTDKTIECESELIYHTNRQKNIQYVLELMELPIQNRSVNLISGNYAVCGFSIHMTRKRMQYFVQVYMPSCMFVVASWISFVVNPDIVPGRMALLVTILLVQLNLFNSAKNKGPDTSSRVNAIDFYLVFSMFLVFFALMEYATVLLMKKMLPSWTLVMVDKTKIKGKVAWNNSINKSNVSEVALDSVGRKNATNLFEVLNNHNTSIAENTDDLKNATEFVCNKMDLISLCMAPIVFSIFNISYFIYYL